MPDPLDGERAVFRAADAGDDEGAGAVKRSRLDSTPLAPLRGNNLRNALGSLGGGGNPFQP